MDVDCDNFKEALSQLNRVLPSSTFVALDLELTGINTGRATEPKPGDTPAQR